MEYVFKIEVATSAVYGNANGDFDQDSEEVSIYIDNETFEQNKDVRELYANEFCAKYNMQPKYAYDLLDDYGLWFVDEEMVKSILTNCVDDLKEIFEEEIKETLEDE